LDSTYVSALSALAGSGIGAVASIGTTWITQRDRPLCQPCLGQSRQSAGIVRCEWTLSWKKFSAEDAEDAQRTHSPALRQLGDVRDPKQPWGKILSCARNSLAGTQVARRHFLF
jgi:hypothetical protein